jgi:ubiquinone/menaquinone biosynthesis C-methylase UbiE
VSFDLVAPYYRWLEQIAFGNALQRARTCWVDTIVRPKRTLLVGEGDGRFLCELMRAFPTIDVDCIDASEAMLKLARARLHRTHPESFSRVNFIRQDIRKWSPQQSYDLLVTHFFLDCFPGEELQAIIAKLARVAEPGAVWLIADFTIPRKRFARAHANVWLRMMYTFFRATAGIAANELVDPAPCLAGRGFIQTAGKLSRARMLKSDVYVSAISARKGADHAADRGASSDLSAIGRGAKSIFMTPLLSDCFFALFGVKVGRATPWKGGR